MALYNIITQSHEETHKTVTKWLERTLRNPVRVRVRFSRPLHHHRIPPHTGVCVNPKYDIVVLPGSFVVYLRDDY